MPEVVPAGVEEAVGVVAADRLVLVERRRDAPRVGEAERRADEERRQHQQHVDVPAREPPTPRPSRSLNGDPRFRRRADRETPVAAHERDGWEPARATSASSPAIGARAGAGAGAAARVRKARRNAA